MEISQLNRITTETDTKQISLFDSGGVYEVRYSYSIVEEPGKPKDIEIESIHFCGGNITDDMMSLDFNGTSVFDLIIEKIKGL